jgi:hypothetical protein
MDCLRSLERLDRGFESHSKAWMFVCVCVLLCVGIGLEYYRVCKNDYETEEEAKAQQRDVEPLMNG